MLKNVSKKTYLGSVITNSHKLLDDVKEDIKHRNFNIIKYYAFLRKNSHAPLYIKIKVLNSCIIASILHKGAVIKYTPPRGGIHFGGHEIF